MENGMMNLARLGAIFKLQITNTKYQTNHNDKNSKPV